MGNQKSPFKWVVLTVGTLFGVAHIGVLGHLINNKAINYPDIHFPNGDYSSYNVEGNRDGYRIEYKANDPAILESSRSLQLNKDKRGWFGPTTEDRREYRSDQYTMDGTRNMGGAVDAEGNRDGYRIEYKANDPAILESSRSLQLNKDKRGWFGPTTEDRREYRSDQYTMDGTRNMGGAVDAEGKSLAKSEECIRADAGARSQGAMAGTAISAGLVVPAVSGIPYIGWLASGWALLLGNNAGSKLGAEIGSVFNDC